MRPTPLIVPLAMALVFALASIGNWRSVAAGDARERESDKTQALFNDYVTAVGVYDQAVQARTICIDGVARSDLNRGQWQLVADAFRTAGREDTAQLLESGPLLSSKPRTIEDCGPAPVAPVAPDGVTPVRTTPTSEVTP